MQDGSVGEDAAEKFLLPWLEQFPGAVVCAISPLVGPAQHPDHRAIGEAAVALLRKGLAHGAELFVEPYCRDAFEGDAELCELAPRGDAVREALRRSAAQYSLWDPRTGRFAIGRHSVTREYDDFVANPRAWYHVIESEGV